MRLAPSVSESGISAGGLESRTKHVAKRLGSAQTATKMAERNVREKQTCCSVIYFILSCCSPSFHQFLSKIITCESLIHLYCFCDLLLFWLHTNDPLFFTWLTMHSQMKTDDRKVYHVSLLNTSGPCWFWRKPFRFFKLVELFNVMKIGTSAYTFTGRWGEARPLESKRCPGVADIGSHLRVFLSNVPAFPGCGVGWGFTLTGAWCFLYQSYIVSETSTVTSNLGCHHILWGPTEGFCSGGQ